MEPSLASDELPNRLLTTIFERAADGASQALSVWLGQTVSMEVNAVDEVDLVEASELLGPPDAQVAACVMGLSGRLPGEVILAFEDASGLALADLLLRQPRGTSSSWDELEKSAACETANIVGCALLNSLAAHLPPLGGASASETLVPTPPTFRHEFAGSLLQFALMDQAMTSERVLLARSRFAADGEALQWSLLFVPGAETLQALTLALGGPSRGQGA